MPREQQRSEENASGNRREAVDVEAEHDPETSRKASMAGLQREAGGLPHADRIQAAFGGHDVSGIKAHVGGSAARDMGAEAYATGDHVVFGREPDLHTAAHEAAHVVQQGQGRVAGGVGRAGDAHEREADAVADRVVAGQSAADLLGAPARGAATPGAAVQLKTEKEESQEQSNQKSYEADSTTLQLLARKLLDAAVTFDQTVAAPTNDAGDEPKFQIIADTFSHALGVVHDASSTVGMSSLDKARQSVLLRDLHAVNAGYDKFNVAYQKADSWAKSKQRELGKNPEWIKQEIQSLHEKLGTTITEIGSEHADPVESGDKLRGEGIKQNLAAAVEAAHAIKAGNAEDARRLRGHISEARGLIREIETDKKALKAHKAEVAHLAEALKLVDAEAVGDAKVSVDQMVALTK